VPGGEKDEQCCFIQMVSDFLSKVFSSSKADAIVDNPAPSEFVRDNIDIALVAAGVAQKCLFHDGEPSRMVSGYAIFFYSAVQSAPMSRLLRRLEQSETNSKLAISRR